MSSKNISAITTSIALKYCNNIVFLFHSFLVITVFLFRYMPTIKTIREKAKKLCLIGQIVIVSQNYLG